MLITHGVPPNHLVQFGRSFIEIVGIADASKLIAHSDESFSFSAHANEFLARREGLAMLVLSSADAASDRTAWDDAGLTTYEPVYFERQAKLPDGESVKVAFTVAFTSSPALPHCAFFVCQQFFPQHFWKPHYQQHANGATNIGTLTLVSPEAPAQLSTFLAAYTGQQPQPRPGGFKLPLACGQVDVVDAVTASVELPLNSEAGNRPAPGEFASLGIEVPSLQSVTSLLEQADVPHRISGDCVDVFPDAVFGVGLRFTEQGGA